MNQTTEPLPPVPGEPPSEKFHLKQFLLETLEVVVLALVLTYVINVFTARVRVENISMLPTLHQGELLLVSKLAYKNQAPKTGEIIIFHAPNTPGEDFIKRVIGAPGDHVAVQDGKVRVNDITLSEHYISSAPAYSGSWEVPEDAVFVLGDNRNSSSDSHSWGFVPLESVVGRAVLVYWPLSNVELLHPERQVSAAPAE